MPIAGRPAGGARRDRTDDLLLAKQALSQLSYGPGHGRAGHSRVDSHAGRKAPRASRPDPKSTHPPRGWWAWVDSNYRPHAYQACALTRLSYRPEAREKEASARTSDPERKRNEDGEARKDRVRLSELSRR